MKKKTVASFVLGISLLVPVASFASSSDEITSGVIDLDAEAKSGVTTQATESAGGGTWQHGFDSKDYVYSYYNHTSMTHKASVAANQRLVQGLWKSKSEGYSNASTPAALFGNKAFWDTK